MDEAAAVLPFDPKFRCTALSQQSGERCRRRAIKGGTVCAVHGGGAPQVRAAARRRLERERLDGEIGRLLDELEMEHAERHPIEVLIDAVTRSSAMVEVLGSLVGRLDATPASLPAQDIGTGGRRGALYGRDHLGDGRPHVLMVMYREWVEIAAKMAKMALEAGVDERRVRLAEQHGAVISDVLRASFDDLLRIVRRAVGVENRALAEAVDVKVREALPAIVGGHLRSVTSASPVLDEEGR